MAVAQALQEASTALRRNPLIAGIVLILVLIQLPTQFAQLAGPIVSAAISLVFSGGALLAGPFLFGGLFGMANEALDGTTSFQTFVEAGKRYYLSMLAAYLLMLGGMIVVGIAASLISFVAVLIIGVLSGGPFGASDPLFIGMFLIGTSVFLLVLFVPLFFVQFYGQAIVVDDQSAVDGLKRSVGLVRQNLVSVFGYSVLVFGAGLIFGAVASIPSMLLSMQMQMTEVPAMLPLPDVSLPVVAALTVVGHILLGLLGSLFLVFSVAFYRTLDSGDATDESPSRRGTVA